MRKPKNRVTDLSAPVLAAMSTRILTRMMKQKTVNPYDQRRLFLFIDRLIEAMDAEEANNALSGRN